MDSQSKSATSTLHRPSAATKDVALMLVERSGRYRIGEPQRPFIKHDNGFLDVYSHQEPTLADRYSLEVWKAKLDVAEITRPEWVDATAAYRWFLHGKGKDRHFEYDRYVKDDPNGKIGLENIIADAVLHIQVIGRNREEFSVTSDQYAVGAFGQSPTLPYPATTNWQRALGAHIVWISAKVLVELNSKLDLVYDADLTFHVEDKFNFNPGGKDIATKTDDAENGRFEITGLAHQYMNIAIMTRNVRWVGGASTWEVKGEKYRKSNR
ncbi:MULTISPECIES: hypothetical protein [unclassified Variovorax]|uniref:hypothetical protein n=1 Tax=unclassified Variovorax TaxID=663243 RepID=UPI001BD4870E|nr:MULTISPECIES: hypothetical protein [unclassified Variovorax]